MGFAPIFGRFCPIFLHLVQELTQSFGEFRNKFCNIFVTILPHLFRFGETSFYGGKKGRFSSFSGHGGGGRTVPPRSWPLRHPFGMPPPLVGEALAVRCAFSFSPEALLLGELSSVSETERLYGRIPCSGNCCFRFRDPEVLPQMKLLLCPTSPSTPFGVAPSPEVGGKGFCCGALCTLT